MVSLQRLLPVVRDLIVGIAKVTDHQPAFEIQEVAFMNVKADAEFSKYGFIDLIADLLIVHIALIGVLSDGHH